MQLIVYKRDSLVTGVFVSALHAVQQVGETAARWVVPGGHLFIKYRSAKRKGRCPVPPSSEGTLRWRGLAWDNDPTLDPGRRRMHNLSRDNVSGAASPVVTRVPQNKMKNVFH